MAGETSDRDELIELMDALPITQPQAEEFLASAWLAGHDREVRAALRKELAAAIEAERDPDGDWEYESALLKAIVIVEGVSGE